MTLAIHDLQSQPTYAGEGGTVYCDCGFGRKKLRPSRPASGGTPSTTLSAYSPCGRGRGVLMTKYKGETEHAYRP